MKKNLKIFKKSDGEATKTTLVELSDEERLDELSRMISGRDVTAEAKAAAAKLLAS